MPDKPRDTQWHKIMESEHAVGAQPQLEKRELDAFAAKVIRSRWFGSRTESKRPVITVKIHKTTRGTYCMADYATADYWLHGDEFVWNTGPYRASKLHALHMLAHFLTPAHLADHGPEFARNYVLAVGRWLGSDTEKTLRSAYREYKVKTYTWSKEAKQRAAERAGDRRFRASGEALKKLAASLEEDW